jgi:hypothetical protein
MDIADQQMRIADASEARAMENFTRYREKFIPIENQFLQEAQDAGGLTDQQRAADQAVAAVNQEAALQQQATDRNMISMGANPSSGKFAGAARARQLMTTARAAGAGTMAREGARLGGIQMRASASNLGRGMMADTTAAGGLALQGGSGSLNAGMAGNNYLMQRGQALGSGVQAAMAGNAGMATGLGNLYNAQVNEAVGRNNAQAQGTAAIGQLAMAGAVAY